MGHGGLLGGGWWVVGGGARCTVHGARCMVHGAMNNPDSHPHPRLGHGWIFGDEDVRWLERGAERLQRSLWGELFQPDTIGECSYG